MKNPKTSVIFNFLGQNFTLPATALRTTNYNGTPLDNPYITIGRKEVPLLFKQYLKAKHPNLLVWGSSRTFANGCSADLNVCNADGTEIPYGSELYKELAGFASSLKGGYFDGMNDIYEYAAPSTTPNGTRIEFGCKYISFEGKAPYGTWPEALRSIKAMMGGEYNWGTQTLEQAIARLRGYDYSDATIQKALGWL